MPGNVDLNQAECNSIRTIEKRDNVAQESHRQNNSDDKNNINNITIRNRNNSIHLSSGNYNKLLCKSIDRRSRFIFIYFFTR